MKITKIEPFIIHVPIPDGIADSMSTVTHWGMPGVVITTDTGLKGYGYTGTHAHLPSDQVIIHYIEAVYSPLVIDETLESVADIERLWKKCYHFSPGQWVGRLGISQLALSCIDIALWDLMAKANDKPLWQLLSSSNKAKQLSAYDTDCGWLSFNEDTLAKGCKAAIDQGYFGVKIKVGKDNINEDLDRIAKVRNAIGDDAKLMIDANGRWELDSIKKILPQLDQFNLFWLEEPLWYEDLQSHIELAKVMKTPIALGEQIYSSFNFETFINAGVVQFAQPDAVRMAGITDWLKVADHAYANNVPVMSHVGDMMQVHWHLAFSHPACNLLEHIPWIKDCVEEPARVENGFFKAPQLPGAGTTILESAFDEYSKPLGFDSLSMS